jgi:hypothetical protein
LTGFGFPIRIIAMKKKLVRPRAMNAQLNKRLLAYAAMAGAGVAGSAVVADAKVVYTPVHKDINLDYYLDLNGDGIPDFHFHSSYLSGLGQLQVIGERTANRAVGIRRVCYFNSLAAAPLKAGVVIRTDAKFSSKANCMIGLADFSSNGPWREVPDHYLGFEFVINGQEHFAWARITGNEWFCCNALARITGYAYETIPGKAIVAGDTGQTEESRAIAGTLGSLALGAPGIELWRKPGQ